MMQAVLPYFHLMRLHKPIGIFLLLWPTLIALWLAGDGAPNISSVYIFVAGVIIMRSAGCVINDYADRNFDLHVVRTKNRPLAKQQLTVAKALTLFAGLIGLAFILFLQLNMYAKLLSCMALFLAVLYPFTKRFSKYPQMFLGLAFAWSIPMAYAQLQGHVYAETWQLFLSTVAWVVAYDTQYAMADKTDDIKLGLKSTALSFGAYDKAIIFVLQLCCLCGFAIIGMQRNFSYIFYAGLCSALGLALYQQWLIKDRDSGKCIAAFLNNNYFGAIIFLTILYSTQAAGILRS